ncbi:nicotinate phosphoribosyltransferase [Clostridium saccharobutylicum]|uniref:Nicotinamide phosphoribosyltransferase n=1 Tax=Clostridium saccharobutylicum DSM 13864 TaxID=1345695 RepID=U5MP61_CLOSA|nr:nicotinate phosphoribosyltransferase [Clostridium saccharobutylicum]AGX42579.1 nicotinamide phosphoribosyltransferase [Clostridium saccharobutylicum DSM 13864]AQR89865.1 putative nicotinate phosphoribosyltransferase [Clostridium saccharobutylicum]AQR99769.1 putative nicotinate phosphoribosyltransferase [Clostridium saccharobutylicum]AQS09497.1 putative nicotinate phosphoribosyltransferase [Clostridium saccharobutylicum]AQS13753.1 putative nicotinate phosphoribosyltransferase [Clostridium sa
MIDPLLLTDFYKTIHHKCYVEGLTKLVSYWTPRMSRKENMNKVVMFGLQSFIKKYLIEYFNENFFNVSKKEIIKEYKRVICNTMGDIAADTFHIEKLHDLGYLPIQIKAVQEGTRVNIKTPMIEITNTHDDFAWLVNYLETFMSCNIWQPMASATIAYRYREIMERYFDLTVENGDVTKSCGDFSMRGFSSIESAQVSSAGHLLSFTGTATISSILYLEKYYNCNIENEVVGIGTPSTEHSVMCSYGTDELKAYKRLINEVFPSGILSIVSDTYDYWNIITNILPILKQDILNRDGKIIIRGDSGDPIKIICGDSGAPQNSPAYKGTVELLWEIFGGQINSKGYKVLNSHIGAIYGDSITVERCEEICNKLMQKGFAVSNCTFGIGSYTYQYNTRDTFGFALKATHAIINGEEKFIFKDPKTDIGKFKKSQKGMCYVYKNGDDIVYKDELTIKEAEEYKDNLLEIVFKDGKLIKDYSLKEIRNKLYGKF